MGEDALECCASRAASVECLPFCAQIERSVGASGDAGHEQQASTEAFKELLLQGLEALKVEYKPGYRDGMPVITHWQYQRMNPPG